MAVRFGLVRAADGQRLGLGQRVRRQHPVACRPVTVQMQPGRAQRQQNVQRHDIGALMQRLKEAVLAAGTGGAPDHRRCRMADGGPFERDRLAV